MKMKRAALAVAALMVPAGSYAKYPEGPVEFVVPWPPGDLEDIVTPMIAAQFQEMYGVPAAVVNKPGGGGPFPGAVEVAVANTPGFSYESEAAFDTLDCNTLASGDADVITTTVRLIMPCPGDLNILAAATDQRIEILPDVPTIGKIAPQPALSTWNELFVRKDTPQDARDAIAKAAQQVVNSDAAKELS